ncbi:MAG: HAD-IC family P-type ATPase [Nanopusillaceae archaeon]
MWHSLDIEEVMKKLNTSINGLSDEEAKKRLKIYGENKLKIKKKSIIELLFEYISNPFLLLFLFADILSFIFQGLLEGSFISFFLVTYILFDYFHEKRSEKIIESLERDIEKNVLVIRNKEQKYIKSSELVPGDIIILRYGERVPADIRIINSIDLEVDESSLTGESTPARKTSEKLPKNIPIKERKNMLFQNTYIIKGLAIGVVVETGSNTYYGRLYKTIEKEKEEKTLLQEELNKFSKYIIIILTIIIFFSFLIIYFKHELSLYQLIIFIIALAIVIIPEGLPTALVLIYNLSTNKLEKKKIYLKNPNLMEDIGNIDVAILDKTGTLTYNKLLIYGFLYNGKIYKIKYKKKNLEIYRNNKKINIKEIRDFILFSFNSIEDYYTINLEKNIGDPINLSIYRLGKYLNFNKFLEKISINYFDPYRKRSSVIVKYNEKKYSIVKGSINSILSISKYILINNRKEKIEKYKEKIKNIIKKYSERGYKIIGVGIKELNNDEDPEKDITLFGLIFIKDKIRKGVKEYLEFLEDIGIKIYIITGDNHEHTKNILNQLNLNYKIIDANKIRKLNDKEIYEILKEYNVIVEADPYDKYRIINILKRKGNKILFIGDGANDAIALKSSNIGITFYNATDIAKDSANVIIMEKGLEPIIELIKEGKRVLYNLKVYIVVILSELIGIFIFISFGFMIYSSIFLQALQLLLLNLVIETINSLFMNSADIKDKNVLKEKRIKIFDKKTIYGIIRNSIFIGISSLIVALATFDNSYIIILFLIFTQAILYIHYENIFKLEITKTREYYLSIFLSVVITSIFLLPYLRNIIQFLLPTIIDFAVLIVVSLYFYTLYKILEKIEGISGI